MNMSPDWVIAWALALGAVSFAVMAILRLKTLIGGKDRSSNPQIDAVVDSLRLEIDDLRADHDHQLTELQERLDFTERLLTKGRDEWLANRDPEERR